MNRSKAELKKAALKNFRTKILFGLLASTFFFVVNCEKTSTRAIKARISPNQKVNPASVLPNCSDTAYTAIKDRFKVVTDIKQMILDNEKNELDAAQKAALQKLIIDLKLASDKAFAEIKKLKVGTAVADGCNQVDPKKPTIKVPHQIAKMIIENTSLAKAVAAITKQSNSILDAAKDAPQDGAAPDAKTTLNESSEFAISAELGDALSESKKDGNMYIVDAKINDGTDAQNELKALLQAKEKSVCILESTSGKLVADTKIKIKLISSSVAADLKSSQTRLLFAAADDKLYMLKCNLNLPAGQSPNDELRRTLGTLIKN